MDSNDNSEEYMEEVLGDDESSNQESSEGKLEQPLREQDRFLPIANIAKIMKRTVPESGKIAKDARECVQECVSEFISFITSEASERCFVEKRKTINGEDLLYAMSTLGFDNYVEPLKLYLQKYREATKGEKSFTGLYEEVSHDSFSSPSLNENVVPEQGVTENSIIYTYTDQIPHFNLS